MAAVASAGAEVHASFDFKSAAFPTGRLEVLADHDNQLSQWRRDRFHALQLEAQHAAQELRCKRSGLNDLMADIAATAKLTDAAAKVHAEGLRVSEAAREATEAASKRYEVAAEARARLQGVEEARLEELRAEEGALWEQDDSMAARAKEIKRFISLYQDRLGLTLSRAAPQAVRVTFTLLDPADPAREFAFSLSLAPVDGEGDGYHVDGLNPALPVHTVDDMLQRLNAADVSEASALPAFACGMRRAFRALVGKV